MAVENHNRLDFLDGLRGFAILQVVIFHFYEISWYSPQVTIFGFHLSLVFLQSTGFLGVDLFLFLSSLCLFLPVAKNPDLLRGKKALKIYALKRAAKIFPSYLLAIFVILTFAPPGYPSTKAMLRDLFLHLTFLHPLDRSSFGSIAGVFWTLGTEVQFYILFPLLARAAAASPKLTFAMLILVAQTYRAGCFYFFEADTYLRNQLPGFLDVYALGMATAWVMSTGEIIGGTRVRTVFFSALSVFFTAALFFDLSMLHQLRSTQDFYKNMQFFCRTPIALLFSGLVLTAQVRFSFTRFWLATRPLMFLGSVSYNWYIWHQLIAVKMVQANWPQAITKDPHQDQVWMSALFWFALCLTFVVAVALTFCFELPLIKYFQNKIQNNYQVKAPSPEFVFVINTAELAESVAAKNRNVRTSA